MRLIYWFVKFLKRLVKMLKLSKDEQTEWLVALRPVR